VGFFTGKKGLLKDFIGKRPALSDRCQADPVAVVNGWFVFGEDDEGAAPDVDAGIKSRSVFQSARDSEANVHGVGHAIGFQGLGECGNDLFSGRHPLVS
jgi:hypothetical protein